MKFGLGLGLSQGRGKNNSTLTGSAILLEGGTNRILLEGDAQAGSNVLLLEGVSYGGGAFSNGFSSGFKVA